MIWTDLEEKKKREGDIFLLYCRHITTVSSSGRKAVHIVVPAKNHHFKQQNYQSLFSSRLVPCCWLNYIQHFYHKSTSRVHPLLMTVWKLTEKRNLKRELNLGLSFVDSLIHSLSSYCILQCSISLSMNFSPLQNRSDWCVLPLRSLLGSRNYYKGQITGHVQQHLNKSYYSVSCTKVLPALSFTSTHQKAPFLLKTVC